MTITRDGKQKKNIVEKYTYKIDEKTARVDCRTPFDVLYRLTGK